MINAAATVFPKRSISELTEIGVGIAEIGHAEPLRHGWWVCSAGGCKVAGILVDTVAVWIRLNLLVTALLSAFR